MEVNVPPRFNIERTHVIDDEAVVLAAVIHRYESCWRKFNPTCIQIWKERFRGLTFVEAVFLIDTLAFELT